MLRGAAVARLLQGLRNRRLVSSISPCGTDVAEQILDFVSENVDSTPEQCLQILESSTEQQKQQGRLGSASQLSLAHACVLMDRGWFGESARRAEDGFDMSRRAQVASEAEALSVASCAVECAFTAINAHLTSGKDEIAVRVSEEVAEYASMDSCYPAVTEQQAEAWANVAAIRATAYRGVAKLAKGEMVEAGSMADAITGPLQQACAGDAEVGDALVLAGIVQLAVGGGGEVEQLFKRAAEATCKMGMRWGPLRDTEASAGLVAAQAALLRRSWGEAEQQLPDVVAACERIGGDRHARVAMPLLLLAQALSRSGLPVHSEGLYRKADQLLGVDAMGAGNYAMPPSQQLRGSCHPTVPAVLYWRLAQLLVAIARETEAAKAADLAQRFCDQAGSFDLERVLGSREALTGQGQSGTGVLIDLQSRRAYPVARSEEGYTG